MSMDSPARAAGAISLALKSPFTEETGLSPPGSGRALSPQIGGASQQESQGQMSRTGLSARCAGLALLVWLALPPAQAAEPAPQFGRYLPLYPGLYLDASYALDPADSSYDRNGDRQGSAAPQAGGHTAFPERRLRASLTWHLPLFEGRDLPFFSSRTHLLRVSLNQASVRTDGRLAEFAADASDDASTDADDLRNNGSGVGDLGFEFGSFLLGSPSSGWRSGERPPYALLATVGVRLPFGRYDRDAPVNAGSNTAAAQLQLGGHWQPWSGGLVDAGFTWRHYFDNEEPAFGALDPARQGSDRLIDLSLAQRLVSGWYASVYGLDRQGGHNRYLNPRYSPNPPSPGGIPGSVDTFPTPGNYQDEGSALRETGLGLHWFASQRVLIGLQYSHPLSGKSGQFLLPYTNRAPAGCTPGGLGCNVSAGDTVLVDGLGAARVFASDRWTLSLRYQFGQGDPYACAGCKR
ncbi:transporter [Stagnimonas aquatica]|uniref:Transporter n=2 Tax=Stagnimonas aquatica TaxID=2689987 RepID=A0A3N0V5J4_9GAMM|nr:transporter [Stagnimonas aquatica]